MLAGLMSRCTMPAACAAYERVGQREAIVQRLRGIEPLAREPIVERLALQQLHDEKGLAALRLPDVVDRADVRMLQRGDGRGFALKAVPGLRHVAESGRKDFEGDIATEPRVARFVDFTHSARAEH